MSTLADEVEHWVVVYGELLATIDELLGRQPAATSTSPEGRLLRTRREEFARSLEHWAAQAFSLSRQSPS